MKRIYIVIYLLVLYTDIFAQQLSLGSNGLFKPGLRVGVSYLPETGGDSLSFGMSATNLSMIIPASGQVEASLKKFNLKLQQTFFTVNAGLRRPVLGFADSQRVVYNFSAGVTQLRAAVRRGIWVYTANLGMVEDLRYLDRVRPFFIGALLRLQIKGLYKHNIYGLAVVYNYRRLLPVPLLGFNRRLSKRWTMSLLLPAQAEVAYRFSRRFSAEAGVDINTFRTSIAGISGYISPGRDSRINMQYRQLRIGSRWKYKFTASFTCIAELGMAAGRRLDFYDRLNELHSYPLKATPYGTLMVHINLGKSPVGSQLFGNEF